MFAPRDVRLAEIDCPATMQDITRYHRRVLVRWACESDDNPRKDVWHGETHERPPVDRKARLKLAPQKIPKQDPNVRVLNWSEVYLPIDLDTAKAEAERCIQCPAAPCQAACPVGNDIPGALWKLEQEIPRRR